MSTQDTQVVKERIVRWSYSKGGGTPCYAYHKRVRATSQKEAIKKAKENDSGWYWLDTWDSSEEPFEYYE